MTPKTIHTLLRATYSSQWNPGAWKYNALNLRQAADLLLSNATVLPSYEFEVRGPATLLYAYAMENAIKAYLIQRHQIKPNEHLQINREHFKLLNSHDLVSLFNKSDLPPVTHTEELLLQLLTSYAEWAGKYPVPFSYESSKTPQKSYFLLSQYDAASPKNTCSNLPPSTLDEHKQHHLQQLFDRTVKRIRSG